MRVSRDKKPRRLHESMQYSKIATMFVMFSIVVPSSALSTTGRRRLVTHGCNSNCRRMSTTTHVPMNSGRVYFPSVGSKMTRLQYRDGHDDDSFRITPPGRGWVPSFAAAGGGTEGGGDEFLASDTSGEQQDVVDDYLKFLDKRYNRLHSNEKKRDDTFSVWKWLTNGSDTDESTEWNVPRVDAHENSLYVLGVADLASRKLLQKHQISSKRLRDESSKAVEESKNAVSVPAPVIDAEVTSTTSTHMSGPWGKDASPIARVASLRKVLLQYQTFKMREMLAKIAIAIRFGLPRVAKFLFLLGGGKRMIALATTSVAAVCMLVIRPTVEAIVSEGAVISKRIG